MVLAVENWPGAEGERRKAESTAERCRERGERMREGGRAKRSSAKRPPRGKAAGAVCYVAAKAATYKDGRRCVQVARGIADLEFEISRGGWAAFERREGIKRNGIQIVEDWLTGLSE